MVTPAKTKLQFKQKLTGSAGEMLKKLKVQRERLLPPFPVDGWMSGRHANENI